MGADETLDRILRAVEIASRESGPVSPRDENTKRELEEYADEIFELIKVASAARTQARGAHSEELTEAEFVALDVLMHSDSDAITVGEIQKQIGVLPAQMSRIIRSLEGKPGGGFVSCSINRSDRRKIDVRISSDGEKAHAAYRETRMRFARIILKDLPIDDRREFMRVLRIIHTGLADRQKSR
jgi:DNA-binding MarR family transcriptional regulator